MPGKVVLLRASLIAEAEVREVKSDVEMVPVASSFTWEANCTAEKYSSGIGYGMQLRVSDTFAAAFVLDAPSEEMQSG